MSMPAVEPNTRLIQRARAEFMEMPGLKLTSSQAARIFGVDADRAKRLLDQLRENGFLVRDGHGAFRRRDTGFDVPQAQNDDPPPRTMMCSTPSASSSRAVVDRWQAVVKRLTACAGSPASSPLRRRHP